VAAPETAADAPVAAEYGEFGIRTRTPESRAMFERVQVATRLSSRLSGLDLADADAIRQGFEELIGKPVGERFTLVPPFYADDGRNISIGRTVFIGYDCTFTGHAPITIGDDVMIAHRVNLITSGHPVPPGQRRDAITAAPITIGTNVWIGAAATVLPGVTIGAGSMVAAGAVVTRDVPPATLVAGNPARVVREL
jgi:acetyltransferase-like isoleucine patch superfamily enzyme